MSERSSVLSPKPPVCVEEPVIRKGLEAGMRLAGSGSVYKLSHAWTPGQKGCEHNIPAGAPCRPCDVSALERAHALLKRGRFDSADCYESRVQEMRATIDGQALEITRLLHALRESEAAVERLIAERSRKFEELSQEMNRLSVAIENGMVEGLKGGSSSSEGVQ